MPRVLPIELPPPLRAIFQGIRASGGWALLVGGCVRDALRGEPTHDLDVEVHGLAATALRELLSRHGRVNEVGRSFGVFKVKCGNVEVDVALPRRDSKVGPGHRGIAAESDPGLDIRQAARRRDLTMNAIAYDPLEGKVEDPFGGVGDIQNKLMRAVDPTTFGEDPLRALRVAQFAARLRFAVDPELAALCRRAPLGELPPERVLGEVEKLLLWGASPAAGWIVAHQLGMWAQVLPAWDRAHPPDLDRLAAVRLAPEARRLALLLAGACRDEDELTSVLDRLHLYRWQGVDVRKQATALIRARDQVPAESDADTRARRLAESVDLEQFAALVNDPSLRDRAEALGVLNAPLPALLNGGDGIALGVPRGPELGGWLARAREAQLLGKFSDRAGALAWARASAG